MAQSLLLEYTCTNSEMEQAQTLALRENLGGGSKWKTRLILFLVLAGLLLDFYFEILRNLALPYQVLSIIAVFGLATLIVLLRKKFRGEPKRATVEVTSEEISISSPNSLVRLPWSAFCNCLESPELFVLLDRPKRTVIVLPKRAFPSESWQNWFRQQAERLSVPFEAASEPPAMSQPRAGRQVTLRVELKLSDYLDRMLASWRIRAIWLAVAGVIVGPDVYSMFNPPPEYVNSPAKVLFVFALPFLLVLIPVVLFIAAFLSWRSERKLLLSRELSLSEEAFLFTGKDGSGSLQWSTYECYKETPWSFIIWRGSNWLMLPKRAFLSANDKDYCRDLLQKHLRRSQWFWC